MDFVRGSSATSPSVQHCAKFKLVHLLVKMCCADPTARRGAAMLGLLGWNYDDDDDASIAIRNFVVAVLVVASRSNMPSPLCRFPLFLCHWQAARVALGVWQEWFASRETQADHAGNSASWTKSESCHDLWRNDHVSSSTFHPYLVLPGSHT